MIEIFEVLWRSNETDLHRDERTLIEPLADAVAKTPGDIIDLAKLAKLVSNRG